MMKKIDDMNEHEVYEVGEEDELNEHEVDGVGEEDEQDEVVEGVHLVDNLSVTLPFGKTTFLIRGRLLCSPWLPCVWVLGVVLAASCPGSLSHPWAVPWPPSCPGSLGRP